MGRLGLWVLMPYQMHLTAAFLACRLLARGVIILMRRMFGIERNCLSCFPVIPNVTREKAMPHISFARTATRRM